MAGAASGVVASMPAEAATIANPVTSITVTPANPRLSDSVRTDVAWCVPDSTTAGDTFSIALPPELVQLPSGFSLRDPSGLLVANVSIVGSPAVATFTFTDYVDTHINVCGTAFFESRLDGSLAPGQTYTLTYVVDGVVTFEPVITTRPGVSTIGRGTARKGAYFGDPTDECRTVAQGCIGWYIESRLGPFTSVTVTDDGVVGFTFECDRLAVSLWSVDAQGNLLRTFDPVSLGATITTTCSPDGFQVVGTNIPANRLMRVLIRATPEVLDPAGGVTFQNAAVVSHVSSDLTVNPDSVTGQRRSARVGGDANGVLVQTTTTTTTTAPAPSTTAPAVSPAPTTTIVAALPPVPPTFSVPPGTQLPATGSNGTMFLAGMFMLLAGLSLLVVARRRHIPSDAR